MESVVTSVCNSWRDVEFNPSLALAELHSLQKRADKATELEFESQRENKRLQKRLDELSTSLESQIQKNNSKLENECQRKLESKEQELAIFKAEAEEKLSSFEAKNMAISKELKSAVQDTSPENSVGVCEMKQQLGFPVFWEKYLCDSHQGAQFVTRKPKRNIGCESSGVRCSTGRYFCD
ncbi:unnamed protein product [Trichobilharzia regenti]|nr:unnamed protein product [Trichobilharzia regenti]